MTKTSIKRLAIFSPYATVGPHFETELEIAQRHLDHGDAVEYVGCFGELAACDFNPSRDGNRCRECSGRRLAGLGMLEPLVSCSDFSLPIQIDSEQEKSKAIIQTVFANVDELKAYKIDNFDIGYAALSSLVSQIRDPEPDLAEHQLILEKCIRSAANVYQFTRDYIEQYSPDRIYVFNGRFASMRAVLRACEITGTDCCLHERGCDTNHFEMFDNHLPHDIEAVDTTIRKMWQAGSRDPSSANFRENVGAQWFVDRVNRVEKSWHSFTTNQKAGLLPDNWNENKTNISIFCSSDDEFVAIGDQWRNRLYPNQVEAIQKIAESMRKHQNRFHLYLRVHPNLSNVENQRKRDMMELSYPNLTIIEPDAPVDTYELMKASDKVVSFGSSVGIEAVFWGRPSILLGPCFYENLAGPYRSTCHDETIDLILSSNLTATDRIGALMYGYWFQTRGNKFKYFEPTGLFEGKFKGQVIHAGMDLAPKQKIGLAEKTKQRLLQLLKSA